MALSATDQLVVWTDFIDRQPGVTATYDQPALKAAAVAIDTWINSNQASFVAALPAAFAQNTNATQKTLMFISVLLRRQGMI
jgi:hypothetical protein